MRDYEAMTPEEQRAHDMWYKAAIRYDGYYGDDTPRAVAKMMGLTPSGKPRRPKPPPRVKTHIENRMDAMDRLLDT